MKSTNAYHDERPRHERPAEAGGLPTSLSARLRASQVRGIFASISAGAVRRTRQYAREQWESPRGLQGRKVIGQWQNEARAGAAVLVLGTVLTTLLILAIDWAVAPLPNPGLVYLPLVGMLAYHWGWRHALVATGFELACFYFLFLPPMGALKGLTERGAEQLVTLALVTGFVLALVQLARSRRALAEREAGRFAALNHVGGALASELDEARLLDLIARTARDLTDAEFATFTLRPLDRFGQPAVPAEGKLFHLAAVVGVTPEQEALLRRMPLGGEGLLAPIFRHGVPVRVPDALALIQQPAPAGARGGMPEAVDSPRDIARRAAYRFSHGSLPVEGLRAVGIPRGHPEVRSFLGAPLLDSGGQVCGGLLLGHSQPGQFTEEDQALLVGLAAQASVALENARLYRAAQIQAQELDATFESITDGITVVDDDGRVLRENAAGRRVRETLERTAGAAAAEAVLDRATPRAREGQGEDGVPVTITDRDGGTHEYIVSASPLRATASGLGWQQTDTGQSDQLEKALGGAVVVWHDVTAARRLLAEQQARAEAEARRTLLQAVIDELPSGVYLVRGRDARLVLANRAAAEVWGAPWPEGQAMSEFVVASGARLFAADGRPLRPEEMATLQAARSGEAVRHHQEIIRHLDGTTLPVLFNAVTVDPRVLGWPLHNGAEQGDTVGEPAVLVVLQDVSALKEAERLKDEFIGIAAHELRNPMAALRGFAEMLVTQTARGRGPELADWQLEAVEAIDQSTARLVELTDDLLDVTRLQGGRLEPHIEPGDLVALVRRVVARIQVTSERHPIMVQAMAEHIVAAIDARRIEQVLSNLINNAIKYSPAGGTVEVAVDADQHAGMAEISVRDHGIGIPAHQQARIFGRFARADNARHQGITGTGLGLYISRELVERHAGRIWFESAEGQGSTFHVALPLADNPAASAEALHTAAL